MYWTRNFLKLCWNMIKLLFFWGNDAPQVYNKFKDYVKKIQLQNI